MSEPQTTPDLPEELRNCAGAIYLACREDVAKDISLLLQRAANEIDRLEDKLLEIESAAEDSRFD